MTARGPRHAAQTPKDLPPAPDERTPSRAEAILLAAPDTLVAGLVSLALAAGLMVSLGQHRPWTTLPAAALIGWLLWRAVRPLGSAPLAPGESPATLAARLHGTRVLLIGAGIWVLACGVLAGEYLIVSRDPGFLTLSGLWLVDHPSTDIPERGAIAAAAVQPNFLADASQAWNLRGDMIQPQGAKMLPALISVGGWVAGTNGVLVANVVVGAVGLIAIYLVARRYLGAMWALVPTGIMGLSAAHIGLSKSAYSEPLTLLLVIAALAWAWRGIEDKRIGPLVAAGVATGATALVRIDGAAFAAGALAALVVSVALTARADDPDAPDRRWRVQAVASFAGAQVLLLGIGYASLWRWSQAYLERLADEAQAVSAAYLGALVVIGLWVATWNRTVRGERLATSLASGLSRRGAMWAGVAVSGVLAMLASRPLWTTVHRSTEGTVDTFTNNVVESFQKLQGLPVEPTRTYAEHTVTWLSYYFTWPIIALSIVGFGIATYQALRGRPAWMLLILGLLAPSILYLLKPEIVPDQIWAIRRFEPAALPAFALAAGLAGFRLGQWLRERLGARRTEGWPRMIAATMLALPVVAWISIAPSDKYPVSVAMHVFTKEMAGARAQIDQLCEVADGRPIVLFGTASHFGTLRTRCDVPVILALDAPTPQDLVELTEVWGVEPVLLTRHEDEVTWSGTPRVVVESTVDQAEYHLQGVPRKVMQSVYLWYAGIPDETGLLVPISHVASIGPAE